MAGPSFLLPVWFDLGATFAFGLTGALAGIRRGYDIVGTFFLALATGIGGGLIRDAVFLPHNGATPLLTDPLYIEAIVLATVAGALFGKHVKRFRRTIALIDALGLGAYAAFGTQKALQVGLSAPAAILVGVINAAGGGLLRDVLTRSEPLVFKPGQFYVLTAVAGAVTFVFVTAQLSFPPTAAGAVTIVVTATFRVLTILFNWRTTAIAGPEERDLTP
ncbi:MAG TPA: TRIC cation channel family protein [Opitutaceae bacterium]|nr:TRIC cation channel family protein [Opitutaceae bacterium]